MSLTSESSISKLEQQIQNIEAEETAKQDESFWAAIKPIKKSISIEEMIVEQKYVPMERDDFYRKVAEIKIEEPLEDLLKSI